MLYAMDNAETHFRPSDPRPAEPTSRNTPLTVQLNDTERTNLAMLVMSILDEWRVAPEDQVAMLGFPQGTKPRELSRYRQGTTPFPDDKDILNHAEHVLGIHESLHVVFPLNRNMPGFWLKNRNKALKGIPLHIMLDEGLSGMHRVWRQLDCTINWVD